jgi:hypothetical protein
VPSLRSVEVVLANAHTCTQPTRSCFLAAPAKGRLVHEDVDRDISFKKPATSIASAGRASSKKDKRKSTTVSVSAEEAGFEKTFGLVGHGFGGDLSVDDGKEALEDDDAFGASAGSGSDSENDELAAAQLDPRTSAAASSKKTAPASGSATTSSAAKPARPSSASALSTAALPAASKGRKSQTASKTAIAAAPSDFEEEGCDSDAAPSGAAASAARTVGATSAGKHGALVAGKVASAIDSAASNGKGKSGAAPPPQSKTALFDSDEENTEDEDVEAASGDEGSGEGETDEDADEEGQEYSSEQEGDEGDDEFSGGDIIAAQRRMDKRAARIAEESAAEMRLNIASGEAAADLFMLPSAGELAEERAGPPNLAVVKKRVEEVIGELACFCMHARASA